MARIKDVLKKAETVRVSQRYAISCAQVAEIYQGSGGWYTAICNGFKIGYMRGMKAAKAEMRKGGIA